MKSHSRLVNRATREVVVESLEVADTYWRRLIGLQFRGEMQAGTGLLLVPCSSVHTFWMRFAIDLAWINRTAEVVAIRQHVRPWRSVVAPEGTHAVLELPAGATRLRPGDRIRLLPDTELGPRSSLQFLL